MPFRALLRHDRNANAREHSAENRALFDRMNTHEPTDITPENITHRRVLAVALPIVLSNATQPILGAVDTGVVGQLGEAAPIGAVGVGAIVIASVYWLFGFLRMGTTALVAQASGGGNLAESGAVVAVME